MLNYVLSKIVTNLLRVLLSGIEQTLDALRVPLPGLRTGEVTGYLFGALVDTLMADCWEGVLLIGSHAPMEIQDAP